MQVPGEEKGPIGIAFDTDMGAIDDVLALGLLEGLSSKKDPEANLISISVSNPNLEAAAFCDAVEGFYSDIANREIPPMFRRRGSGLPIGMSTKGKVPEEAAMLKGALGKLDAEGKPVYSHGIHKLNDTADAAALIRNAFTAQHDQNAALVMTGPATNLVQVLDVRGAKEIISQKVRFLCVMGGAYPSGEPEYNIKTDIAAAKRLFAEWPTPIVASGYEIGEALLYPAASIEKDFAWAENHPIVDVYRAYQAMPYDTPTWDLSAVLYAIRPDEGYFKLSDPGTISVLDDGRTKFTAAPNGQHRYLILDPAQKDRIIQTYTEWVSAQPPPRELPRFLKRLIEEEQKKEEEKKQQEQQQQAKPPE
jgi:inosine-uridine nucleoside N-ribohydrolase